MNPIGGMGGHMPMGPMQQMSPQAKLGEELQNMVESGEISTEDQEALSGALYEIGSELKSSRPEIRTERPSKEEMQAKIDGLINEQVESGELTEEQAEQLSSLFEEVASNRPEAGAGGKPPPPPGGARPGGQGGDQEMLGQFLQMLQEQSSSSYGESGSVNSDGSVLFDYVA